MSGWQVFRLKMGEKKFSLRGHGLDLRGEVWRGAMKDDVFWGLKALEHPQAGERVLHRWRVPLRNSVDGVKNTGGDRRFVFLEAPDAAQVVLRFDQTVPKELLEALKEAFQGPRSKRKEPTHEEPPAEPVLDPAEPPERHRPGLDADAAREAAREGHPGAQGLEEGLTSTPPEGEGRTSNAARNRIPKKRNGRIKRPARRK